MNAQQEPPFDLIYQKKKKRFFSNCDGLALLTGQSLELPRTGNVHRLASGHVYEGLSILDYPLNVSMEAYLY